MACSSAECGDRGRLRALEFYAGVGGFHYGLLRSGIDAEVVGSYDLNPTANRIYGHNFPNTAHLNRNICGLTASDLDKLDPDIVHMSPPCQPFTRQGLRRDNEDRRTDSFFHLMLTMSEMKKPPSYILMENVQGFESSHTRNEFTQTLQRMGFTYQEFLLSPNQFRVPNSRLRYYLLAKKRPLSFAMEPAESSEQPSKNAQALIDCVAALSKNPLLHCPLEKTEREDCAAQTSSPRATTYTSPSALSPLVSTDPSWSNSSASTLVDTDTSSAILAPNSPSVAPPPPSLSSYLEPLTEDQLTLHLVPKHILNKYALALDIVQQSSTHSCCFTRGYGNYAVGTGSVLQHALSEEDMHTAFKEFKEKQAAGETETPFECLTPLQLRYFTPREVANLMCFPREFSIPRDVTLRQSYKVLGNSLNVLVVSVLLKYLVHDFTTL